MSSSDYLMKSVVVLHTRDGFRVGVVTGKDFSEGLSRLNMAQHRLNTTVARRCFGESRRYSDRNDALAAAEKIPSEHGIKILHFPEDCFPTDSIAA